MSEINARRLGQLVRGVFQLLISEPDGLPAKTTLERLPTLVPPTDFEKTYYPDRPNVRRYEKIVRFSTIAPVKAGWMVKNKGDWSLTDEGRAAYSRYSDPEQFTREARTLYYKWKAAQPVVDENPEVEEPAKEAATTLEESEEDAWREIEMYLRAMYPYDFQQLVAKLLEAMGYYVVWIAPPGPDGGVDVIAQSDPLGVRGPRIKVQVKRSDRMTVKEIRSFLAVVADGDVGLFVSAGGFTKDAQEEVRNQEKRRAMLLDLRKFVDLWIEHYPKLSDEARRLLPIKPVWFLTPLD